MVVTMPVPKKIVIDKFHSCFKSRTEILEELENEFMDSAFAEYELEFGREIDYDENSKTINNNLKRTDILLIAKFMYRQHWQQQLSRFAEMKGLSTTEMSITGIADSKAMATKMQKIASEEINEIIHKMRANTIYD